MSKVSGKSQVKETLLKVAEKRNDSALESRIASVNLVEQKAWYHRKCYQAYTSEGNINALWESVIVLCFVVRYFMSILVLQSS